MNWYSNENSFLEDSEKTTDWYKRKGLLKYTLFEYELRLLLEEGKNKAPHLKWEDLSDSTIEHILPQTIDEQYNWSKTWTEIEINTSLHSIGNLVLTESNSHYRNFDFERKKGSAGNGFCYANSDIRQERKISHFPKWEVYECMERLNTLAIFIKDRWGSKVLNTEALTIQDDEDE